MSLHKYLERIRYMDWLIRKKTTGNVEMFAKKLHLSKSGTEKFIHEMKELGFPISYSKKLKSYIYRRDGQMVKKLFFEEMDEEEMRKVTGGKNAFDSFQLFSNRNYTTFCESNFVNEIRGTVSKNNFQKMKSTEQSNPVSEK